MSLDVDGTKVKISPMHDDRHDNIFSDDDALDFILYEEFEKQDRKRKGDKGGCLSIVVLILLPVASVVLLSWK
jgi:hypothetical protein